MFSKLQKESRIMTILITGASRGIGLALAAHAQQHKKAVIGTYRGNQKPSQTGVEWHGLDVTDFAAQKALASHLATRPLSLLVCNAGVYLDKGHQLEKDYPVDLWAQSFAVNVTGVFLTIQSFLPHVRAGKGKIAIISSQMASDTNAPGGSYIYRSSKAAVLNLGRNLATDLRHEGIPVGIYHPGWVQTDMGGKAASITPREAATGLWDRFAELSLQKTGCFECWDGRPHPF
jgi:NAD(P)-dependent dehydrogenase (short-subunit alcohol dehydrogenase family)